MAFRVRKILGTLEKRGSEYTDSGNVFTSLLPPNSDHVMIHLGGYNWGICLTQQIGSIYKQNNCNLASKSESFYEMQIFEDEVS